MYIKVHAVPNAKKEHLAKESNDIFVIKVREPASQNRANKRIAQLLAEEYGVSVTQVHLLTGHRSSSKMYSIETD